MESTQHPTQEAVRRISWRRGFSDYDFMRRWSKEHLVREEGSHTLCGVAPRWPYEGPGDGRKCERCLSIARKRGERDEYGEEF